MTCTSDHSRVDQFTFPEHTLTTPGVVVSLLGTYNIRGPGVEAWCLLIHANASLSLPSCSAKMTPFSLNRTRRHPVVVAVVIW
jgi:hypothetical protein